MKTGKEKNSNDSEIQVVVLLTVARGQTLPPPSISTKVCSKFGTFRILTEMSVHKPTATRFVLVLSSAEDKWDKIEQNDATYCNR